MTRDKPVIFHTIGLSGLSYGRAVSILELFAIDRVVDLYPHATASGDVVFSAQSVEALRENHSDFELFKYHKHRAKFWLPTITAPFFDTAFSQSTSDDALRCTPCALHRRLQATAGDRTLIFIKAIDALEYQVRRGIRVAAIGWFQDPQLCLRINLANELERRGITVVHIDPRWPSNEKVRTSYGTYEVFEIKKRQGGQRRIEAPDSRLKALQRTILARCSPIPISPFSYGIARGPRQAARAHLSSGVVVRVDVQNFFASITPALFQSLGVHRRLARFAGVSAASLLDILFIPGEPTHLPQGAPTSPLAADLYMLQADYGIARDLCRLAVFNNLDPRDIAYTRYVDDLVVSVSSAIELEYKQESALIGILERRINDRGLKLSPEKTRVWRSGQAQVVLGYSVGGKHLQVRRTTRAYGRRIAWKLAHGETISQSERSLLSYALSARIRLPSRLNLEANYDAISERDTSASVAGILSRGVFERWGRFQRSKSPQDILDASMAILCNRAVLGGTGSTPFLQNCATSEIFPLLALEWSALRCVTCSVIYPRQCRMHHTGCVS